MDFQKWGSALLQECVVQPVGQGTAALGRSKIRYCISQRGFVYPLLDLVEFSIPLRNPSPRKFCPINNFHADLLLLV